MAGLLGKITITNLRVRAVVGFVPWERQIRQELAISMVLHLDLAAAASSDEVADTVDYKALKKTVSAYVEAGRFNLIERVAADVADLCLADNKVMRAGVTVDKLGALRGADSVSVTVMKEREVCG